MNETRQPADQTTDAYEQLRTHVKTIEEELDQIERIAEDHGVPVIERNAAHLRAVLQSVEMNLPPESGRSDD